jgi:hypothetical protein
MVHFGAPLTCPARFAVELAVLGVSEPIVRIDVEVLAETRPPPCAGAAQELDPWVNDALLRIEGVRQ